MRTLIRLAPFLSLALAIATVAAEGPCDAWSDDCREMEQANTCLAAFITRSSKADILRCVSPDEATATRIVRDFYYCFEDGEDQRLSADTNIQFCSCYGCSEPVVQRFAVTNITCPAVNATN